MMLLAQRSLFVFLYSLNIYCFGQGCDDDYFSVRFHGQYGQSYKSSAINNKNEVVLVGSQVQVGNFRNDAIITKLTAQGSVLWSRREGFDSYTWMNTPITDSFFTVRAPGIYKVSVSNSCGSKTIEKEVYAKCEFAIYMPTAFTPNGDGLNDVFRVPRQNKNLLVQLIIYNRWGQKVFETADVDKGWDGTYKGIKQPVGSYVYLLKMKPISGRPISSKGVFTLIR